MRYSRVHIESFGYQLGTHVVTSVAIEERLAPLYQELRFQRGQLEALTGIRERRYWDAGQTMSDGAVRAGRKALENCRIDPRDIGMLVYGGVCRDQMEPATACAVANGLGISGDAQVYDISNACLGVMNGIVHVANAIELGQVKAGLVVSCESARQIVDITIDRLLAERTMENFRLSLATLTGGSGAIGVVVADASIATGGRKLLGGVMRANPKWHELCRWGPDTGIPASGPQIMRTDAAGVLNHGVALGIETWREFRRELGWSPAGDGTIGPPDKLICHQVGGTHQASVLQAIGYPPERDFTTFQYLGNIGTVSLPITAAIAEERGFLQPGDRVGFLGIGSGLNCLMLGLEW